MVFASTQAGIAALNSRGRVPPSLAPKFKATSCYDPGNPSTPCHVWQPCEDEWGDVDAVIIKLIRYELTLNINQPCNRTFKSGVMNLTLPPATQNALSDELIRYVYHERDRDQS
ncbi:hypothetical protein HNY73_017939 [Argiope bruennichi]|uniref:Uncharacterized protein n=1 Tax=Argiope bruennichi TaxID=94029 RepID=A0A8T0EC63_ARGBR|nr:hypothetical protein HNY73_017939 [Argiope bruennichi]